MINRMFDKFYKILLFLVFLATCQYAEAERKHGKWTIRVQEYNVENLFDCYHDSLKVDTDFTPDGSYKWTPSKYWKKLNAVARGIVLSSTENGTFVAPDIIGLCEVENDSVLYSLTHKSLLRGAGYEYVMTESPDVRGVDVALLYQPVSFRLVSHYGLRVDTLPEMRPTRDILYVKGEVKATTKSEVANESAEGAGALNGVEYTPLHVFVVHAPSRRGGEQMTRKFRLAVANRLLQSVDSIRSTEQDANILVMGDFNDYDGDASLVALDNHGLKDVTTKPYLTEDKTVRGTYRYQGEWGSLDHIFVSEPMLENFQSSRIAYHPDMLSDDEKYGGKMPYRFFRGPIVNGGYSDHLPLIADFRF